MWERGIVETDAGEVIARPGMTLGELLAAGVAAAATVRRTGADRHLVRIGTVSIVHHQWVAAAYYLKNRLNVLRLGLSPDEAQRMFGAEPWKENLDEVSFYKSCVERETGRQPPVVLPWGMIQAGFDKISSFSDISFRYNL